VIRFPTTIEQALTAPGVVRAGGTDLSERRRHGITTGPLVDLRDLPGLDAITPTEDGGLKIGAKVTVAALAADPSVALGWPGLAAAAGGLATPQIRNRATVGGNILQDVRCWYYRNPDFQCLKSGGSGCLARMGDHLYHSVIDQGPCIAPHPSTLAMALLAFDAFAIVDDAEGTTTIPLIDLLGDGSDATTTHALPDGALLTGIVLAPPTEGDRSAYVRAIARQRAEWPLVEVVARLSVVDGKIADASVSVGGVANTPLLLDAVAAILIGRAPGAETFARAADAAARGVTPLPMTGYKVALLSGSVLEALERAEQAEPASALKETVE
jgi:xanthine dehydrogenase YagS FAD-binding subunit